MNNPFTLGIVRGKENFCNRKRELNDILKYARNGDNAVIFSPRKYGKSSLVTVALDILEKEKILPVYIDLFRVSSEQEVVSRFASGVYKGIGRGADSSTIIDKVKDLFSRIVVSVDVTPGGYSTSAKFDRKTESGLLLDDIMDGTYKYVQKKHIRACIVLDEFQEITELPQGKKIEGTLRSHMQFHREISYLYVGSRRRTLKDIFTDKARPFYKSAFLYVLHEIPKADFVPYIEKKFKETGKICLRDVAAGIYSTVRGYPYYVQKLAHFVWDISEKKCNIDNVSTAFGLLLDAEAAEFEGIWSGLTLVQKSLLKAIAKEPISSPYTKDFLERHDLSLGGTQNALKALLLKDIIEQDDKENYRLTDPIMEKWLLKD